MSANSNENARNLALDILIRIEKDNSYSNLAIDGALKEAPSLSNADKAFFTALVYGTVERKITLDYNLELYLKEPLKKLNPVVLCALRLGAYQILFMEKIPDTAAINETVSLVKRRAGYASGLTNAVLRKVSVNGLRLPDADDESYLSVKYSFPEWLVKMWINAYGENDAVGIMEHSLGPQKTYIRMNTLEIDLNENGLSLSPCAEYSFSGALEDSADYNAGMFHVQDKSSQMCCEALGAMAGETVFDMCAAPGGKSFTMAEMMDNKGVIKAFDLHEHRVELIKDGAARLGIDIIEARVSDAEKYDESLGLADRILCDVPCSGLGIVGRKPEIRYKTATNIDYLPSLQYNILVNSSKYLRAGGTLVYSTCALNPKENEEVVSRFLDEHRDFELKTIKTVLPHVYDCDGFFYAVLKKGDRN